MRKVSQSQSVGLRRVVQQLYFASSPVYRSTVDIWQNTAVVRRWVNCSNSASNRSVCSFALHMLVFFEHRLLLIRFIKGTYISLGMGSRSGEHIYFSIILPYNICYNSVLLACFLRSSLL